MDAGRDGWTRTGRQSVRTMPDAASCVEPPARRLGGRAVDRRVRAGRGAHVVAQGSRGRFLDPVRPPGATRMPLSGSSVSSTSPTWIEPRPSNTTIACSAPRVAVPRVATRPARARPRVDRERRRPEVAGLDEQPAPDPVALDDLRVGAPPDRLAVIVPAPEQLAQPPRGSGSVTAARRARASTVPSLRTRWCSAGASYRTSPARTTARRSSSSPCSNTSSPPAR